MPLVRSSEAESGTLTRAEFPLNARPLLNRPDVHVAPLSVPVFPLPELSATVESMAQAPLVESASDEPRRRRKSLIEMAVDAADLVGPEELAAALRAAGKDVELHVIDAPYGHDCFLLEEARQTPMIQKFLSRQELGAGR